MIFLRNDRDCKVFVQNQFSRHNKKNDTTAQLYCTLSTYVTPKTISRHEPKKLTQHHNCMVLQVHSSMYNQNLFPTRTKTDTTAQLEKRFLQPTQSVGRFLQPTQSKCIRSSVHPSVCLSVCLSVCE